MQMCRYAKLGWACLCFWMYYKLLVLRLFFNSLWPWRLLYTWRSCIAYLQMCKIRLGVPMFLDVLLIVGASLIFNDL